MRERSQLSFIVFFTLVVILLGGAAETYGQSRFMMDKPQILQIFPNDTVVMTDYTRIDLAGVKWDDDHNAYAYIVHFKHRWYDDPFHVYTEYWPQGEMPDWDDIIMRAIDAVYGD